MIGSFPDPYPDELLYSVCARFQARMQYPNKKIPQQQLFSTTCRTAAVDLPSNIKHLLSNLPPLHRYTADQIIDGHTLLPYFAPFLPCERVTQLREDMQGAGGLRIHRRSGVMASRIPTTARFRFCPLCVDKDRERYGETYWHRIHQTTGVEVCHAHEVFLINSDVRRDSGKACVGFIAAENSCRTSSVHYIDTSNRCHQILLKIARDVSWLLEHPKPEIDLNKLYNRYIRLLIERGLASYTGSIHVSKLLEEFKRHYSPSLLRLLHCEFSGSDQIKTNWLLRLVRPPKHTQHPLYHLLLIQFLGCMAKEFFQLSTELTPFGEGPWPCLNPAAEHFREPVISEYKLSPKLRNGRPTAAFSCGCGFAYARSGPDSSPEDRLRVGRMISFGSVWEAELKRLWKHPSLSISEVGRRLGIDTLTVRRHAERLKLSSSHSSRKSKPLDHAARLKDSHDSRAQAQKQCAYRTRWTSTIQQSPDTTLKALRRKHPREYAWLLQNDSEWLGRHTPYYQRSARTTSGVDWRKRDAEYAVNVRAAAANLKNKHGRPVQVTKTAIGKTLSAVTLLRQKLSKMPLTAQVLMGVVETREQYAMRRVWWAADLLIEEGVLPRYWQLISRANVYSLREDPEVKDVIEAALLKLVATLRPESRESAAS
jgi:hypothetical protein